MLGEGVGQLEVERAELVEWCKLHARDAACVQGATHTCILSQC